MAELDGHGVAAVLAADAVVQLLAGSLAHGTRYEVAKVQVSKAPHIDRQRERRFWQDFWEILKNFVQRHYTTKKSRGFSTKTVRTLSEFSRDFVGKSRDLVGAARKAEVPGASEKGQNNPLSFTPGIGFSPAI